MDVFDYEDYRAFLRDWLTDNPRVTHRDVMRAIGSRDPSFVAHVLSGRRHLSERLVAPLCRALQLDPDGAEWFAALVAHARARTPATRASCAIRLEGLRATQDAARLADPAAYASWARVAVHELTQCAGFRPDPRWVAEQFDPPLAPDAAADAVRHLARSRSRVRTTPKVVRHPEVFAYYRGIQAQTGEALDRLERDPAWVEQTQFLGLTMAIPASTVPALRQRLAELHQELMGVGATGSPEVVVQVNLQLYPLTRGADARVSLADARPERS